MKTLRRRYKEEKKKRVFGKHEIDKRKEKSKKGKEARGGCDKNNCSRASSETGCAFDRSFLKFMRKHPSVKASYIIL